jgi:hypothetical protein
MDVDSPVPQSSRLTSPVSSATKRRLIADDDDSPVSYPPPASVHNTTASLNSTVQTTDDMDGLDFMDVDDSGMVERLQAFSMGSQVAPVRSVNADVVKRATRTHEKDIDAILAMDEDDSENNVSKFEFVRNPRDRENRTPTDPDYDHTRIRIPTKVYDSLTGPQQVYWTLKQDNYDKVIFYQQGDFYNMFGPDAQIGVKEFDFKYNAKLDSVGFNRSSLDKYLQLFASRGCVVMVVEQAHTAETDLEKAEKRGNKKGENRQVTQQFTPGTRRQLELVEGISENICTSEMIFAFHSAPGNSQRLRIFFLFCGADLFVIVEEQHEDGTSSFGVAVTDTSNGELLLVHIDDDERVSLLETLLMRFRPVEVHIDRSQISAKTKKLLATTLQSPFYSYDKFVKAPMSRETLLQKEFRALIQLDQVMSYFEYEPKMDGYACDRDFINPPR